MFICGYNAFYGWRFTYPIVVASGVANDGSENITVPNNVTTTARIRVMSENGTFYDISNNDFEITAANNMVANFTSNNTTICEGGSVDFTDASAGNPVSWSWVFNGGNPSISSAQNPVGIQYISSGIYDVELTVSDGVSTNTIVETSYVNVSSCLGTSDLLNNEFTIYPNPVNDKVTIEFIKPSMYEELRMLDNLGKVVFQKKLSSVLVENIDMRPYSSGLYSFMLSGDQKTRVVRVFKK